MSTKTKNGDFSDGKSEIVALTEDFLCRLNKNQMSIDIKIYYTNLKFLWTPRYQLLETMNMNLICLILR